MSPRDLLLPRLTHPDIPAVTRSSTTPEAEDDGAAGQVCPGRRSPIPEEHVARPRDQSHLCLEGLFLSFFSSLAARVRTSLLRRHGPSGEALPRDPSSEDDVAPDPGLGSSRATGGEHVVLTGDSGSVTGTGQTGTFVGQVAGDDLGYAEETGAERRRNPAGPDDDAGSGGRGTPSR